MDCSIYAIQEFFVLDFLKRWDTSNLKTVAADFMKNNFPRRTYVRGEALEY